jgi:4'-phosphopantetheinyl transferase EntD
VLSDKDRAPVWPPAVVGSITHTEGYSAAVVGRKRALCGLGIDCETVAAVTPEVWSGICAPSELDFLGRLPSALQSAHAALIFAAKEAFYKFQFPLTRQWVGFEDVVIESDDWCAPGGPFRVVPRKLLGLEQRFLDALQCRFRFCEGWVITGVAASA